MPDYIAGIFNYCDRWCERCPLTARCRQFAMQQLMNRRSDMQNAEFWKEMDLIFPKNPEFEAIIAEAMEAVEEDTPLLDIPFDKPDTPTPEERLERLERDPLVRAAFDYADDVRKWQSATGLRHSERPAGNPASAALDDALDVIEWYSLQIGVKLSRATRPSLDLEDDAVFASSLDDEPSDNEPFDEEPDSDEPFAAPWDDDGDATWEDDITQTMREAEQSDRDGSAKVALIGIERSLGAFTILRRELRAEESGIRGLLGRLARLRVALDRRFPGARTFIRPGFDDE
jgi:hypothetical protein